MLIHFTPRNFAEKCCFRGWPFDFLGGEGGIGDLGKKISCRLISRGKKPCKEIPRGKKFLHWKTSLSLCIILEKKVLHCCMSGKKFYLQRFGGKILTRSPIPPSPPQKSNGQPLTFFFSFSAVFVLLFSYMVWKIPSPYTNIYVNVKVVHDNITTVTVDIKGGTREEDQSAWDAMGGL